MNEKWVKADIVVDKVLFGKVVIYNKQLIVIIMRGNKIIYF